jgi:hypothetical protein
MARILVVLLALGAVYYLYKHSAGSAAQTPDASSNAPIDRARRAAAASDARTSAAEPAQAEADGTRVSENMTPDQVRALLGSPSDIRTETTDGGVRREIWTYGSVGKTVVFEDGVAVSIR